MANYIVTTLADENDAGATSASPGGAGLSLREALALANSTAAADTITFAASLAGQTLTLSQGELVIASDVTIDGDVDGDDKADITIDANQASRVVDVAAGAVEIASLTLTGGHAIGAVHTFAAAGGGIRVAAGASLTLISSSVTDSAADNRGGAIYNLGTTTIINSTLSGNYGFAGGGGAFNRGNLDLVNTTVSGNSSTFGAGLYSFDSAANLTVSNSTVSGNFASHGPGGLVMYGSATLANSIVAGNWGNGAISDIGSSFGFTYAGVNVFSQAGLGAAGDIHEPDLANIFAAVTTIDPDGTPNNGDEFETGLLADNGGPVQTIALAASPTNPAIDAGDDSLDTPFDARGLPRSDIPGVAHNGANISDIGAFELQLETPSLVVTTAADVVDPFDSQTSLREALAFAESNPGADTITFVASLAGQALVLTQGALTITHDVTIDGDAVGNDGKADITISGGDTSRVFTVDDGSTFTFVTATLDSLTIVHGSATKGGGIYVGLNDVLVLNHSTVSQNAATFGGGIFADYQASVYVNDSVVSDNTATQFGGGINANGFPPNGSATVLLTNTTVSGNHADASGGGILGYNANVITLINSTVTGNSAGQSGGGIYNYGADGVTSLVNSIVAGNAANDAGDDLAGSRDSASPTSFASLVLSGGNVLGSAAANFAHVQGAATAMIDGTSASALGTVFADVATDPHTGVVSGVLADNGGPVETVALTASATNPAIDGGSDGLPGMPATDAPRCAGRCAGCCA
jgi:hypothetical protein